MGLEASIPIALLETKDQLQLHCALALILCPRPSLGHIPMSRENSIHRVNKIFQAMNSKLKSSVTEKFPSS